MFNPISNNERQFILSYLKTKELREDNRREDEYRTISIKKLKENGQIEVKFGKTLIISQIFAKLVSPNADRPNEGIIVFSLDFNHLRPNSEFTQSNEELNETRTKINNLIEKSLRDSKAFDTFSLCVVAGKLVWKIVMDINVVNNDGNIYDACSLAALASWTSFKLPFLRKAGEKVLIPKQMINLSTLHIPVSVTLGLYTDGNQIKFLIDPTLKEEKCLDGIIIVSANKFNEICYMHSYYSVQIERETLDE